MFGQKKNIKSISAIISTLLLLSITIISVLGFQLWYDSNLSLTLSNVEEVSNRNIKTVSISALIGNTLYINNKNNDTLKIKDIKVDGVSCLIQLSNISLGTTEVNIENCLLMAKSSTPEIILITDYGLISKIIYLKDFKNRYLSCTLDGILKNHGQGYNFYNSSNVAYGQECSYILRVCDNGTYTGNESFTFKDCFLENQDTHPDEFSFTNYSLINFSTLVLSEEVTVTGFDGILTVTVTGSGNPEISINNDSFTNIAQISANDNLRIRLTSSANASEKHIVNITVGNYSTLWSVQTKDYIQITESLGIKHWEDDTYALNCKGYKTPYNSNYNYGGEIGSGTYRIDPDGIGPISAFDVYCEMDLLDGGWTKIIYGYDTTLAYMSKFGSTSQISSTFHKDSSKGISWGTNSDSNARTFNIANIGFSEYFLEFSGYYNIPSNSLGLIRITNSSLNGQNWDTANYTNVFVSFGLSDGHSNPLNMQYLSYDNNTVNIGDIINQQVVINSNTSYINIFYYQGYPIGYRYINKLYVR